MARESAVGSHSYGDGKGDMKLMRVGRGSRRDCVEQERSQDSTGSEMVIG